MSEPTLNMAYISNDDEVKVGEHVVTNGMDRIFPRDLPVGTIVEVKPGSPPFKYIRVRPSAQIEKLEEVIVLLTTSSLDIKKEADTADAATKDATAKDVAAKQAVGKRTQEPSAKNPEKPR